MKHILIITFFLISTQVITAQIMRDYPVTNLGKAQVIVNYTLEYMEDTTNPSFIQLEDMSLLISPEVSEFINTDFHNYNKLIKRISDERFDEIISDPNLPMPRFLYKIYKNYPKGKITVTDALVTGYFKYEENLLQFNWELLDERDTLYGYHVQKAICEFGGRKWIAWFCKDIEYNDGPYKFNGLPGLILRIHDSDIHYLFEFVSFIGASEEIVEFQDRDYISTSKNGFFKAEDSFKYEIIERAKEAGIGVEGQRSISIQMKARNNPLERDRM